MRISPLTLLVLLTGIYTVLKGQLLDIYVGTVINTSILGNSTPQTILESPDGNLIILTEDYIYVVTVSTEDGPLTISNAIRHPTKLTPLYDAVLLNNTHVLYSNKDTCLRTFDLNTGDISVFAGSCGKSGSYDGVLLNSTFSRIHGLLKIDDNIYLVQSDNRTGLIRLLEGGRVSTLHPEPALSAEPGYMTTCNGVYIYLTTAYDTFVRIKIDSNETLSITQSDRTPRGLTMLSPNILLFADFENSILVITNLESTAVSMICNGANASINGNRMTCSFNHPFSIFLYKDQILVGEKGSIRTIPLFSIIEANSYDNEKCYYTSRFVTTTPTNTPTSQQTTPYISNIPVNSMGNTEFLQGQLVKRIIDLPADRLLIVTDRVVYISSLRLYSDGVTGILSDHSQLTYSSVDFNAYIDALLLNNTHILLTRRNMHCLIAVDLRNGNIRTYAGNCNEMGTRDGFLLEARFIHPNSMLMVQRVIYIIHSLLYTPMRLVSGEQVTAVVNDVDTVIPLYIFSCVGSYSYITFLHGLAQLDLASKNIVVISGSTDAGFKDGDLTMGQFDEPNGLVMLGRDIILVVDHKNNRLRIIDRSNNSVQSVCDGLRRSTDGNFTVCSFYNPFSVHLYKNLILVGELGNIRIIQRRLIINDAVFERTKCLNVRGDNLTTNTLPATTSVPIAIIGQTSTTLSDSSGISATIPSTTAQPITTQSITTPSITTQPIATQSITTQSITTQSITAQSITAQSITTEVNPTSKKKTTNLVIGILVTVVCLALLAGGIYFLIQKCFIRKNRKVGNSSKTKPVKNASESELRSTKSII